MTIALLGVLFLNGCYCREYAPQEVCVEYGEKTEVSCLSEVRYYLPYNYTGEINMMLESNDLCYDFETDPNQYKEEVDKVFEEHPDDWEDYMNWSGTKYDPVVTFYYDNITEIRKENIFNNTRLTDVCVRTETRQVCVR